MTERNRVVASMLVATVALFMVTGCRGSSIRVGSLKTGSETVDLGDASSVEVEIKIAAGKLEMAGGASDLLEADFTYNVAELEPEVKFRNDKLSVLTPDVESKDVGILWDVDNYRNEWDLQLNDEVPMDMKITVGAGTSDLDLGSLSLTTLDIDAGAGAMTLDLSGATSLTRLSIDAGVGEVTLDLTGDWQQDLDATIRAGVGRLTVLLPRDVGVRLDVEGGISDIDTRGLSRDGGNYVNDAYGESEVTLRIEIDAGIGEIDLEVAD